MVRILLEHMTLQGQLFRRGAICTATMEDQNMFTVNDGDLQSSAAEVGDQVRVGILKRGSSDTIKALDRQTFTTTLMPNGQIMVPNDAANTLDLEAGDSISYVVVPKKSFPSLTDGPLRDKVRGGDNDAEEIERGEREATEATFGGQKMRQTGQTRVPGEVKEKLALVQGDKVNVTVEHNEDSDTFTGTFGTGDRVTIPKETRDGLGLQKGDEPTLTVRVTD